MPTDLVKRAERLMSQGDAAPPPPEARPASTVILLDQRRHAAGDAVLSTYLMRRVTTMAFAAGMYVFPGGRVSPEDGDPGVPWRPSGGFDLDAEASRITADAGLARALIVCAARETFEETGVLIARDERGEVARQPHGGPDAAWERDRLDLVEGRTGFADILASRGLAVDPLLLASWSHWITPEVEERRYDVRFYVARLPAGQEAVDIDVAAGGEADHVHWIAPATALDGYSDGELAMLPPTVATLLELGEFADADGVLAAAPRRVIVPLLPRPMAMVGGIRWALVDSRDGSVVSLQDGPPEGSESRGIAP